MGRDLRPAFDADFDDARKFSFGLAAVYDGADAGYIDTSGRMRLLLPHEDLQPFNEFGLAIVNRDELQGDYDIIDQTGRARVSGLDSADFWGGDFPYFDVTKNGNDHLLDMNCRFLF